jgi:hypothetical protein
LPDNWQPGKTGWKGWLARPESWKAKTKIEDSRRGSIPRTLRCLINQKTYDYGKDKEQRAGNGKGLFAGHLFGF